MNGTGLSQHSFHHISCLSWLMWVPPVLPNLPKPRFWDVEVRRVDLVWSLYLNPIIWMLLGRLSLLYPLQVEWVKMPCVYR